MKCHVPIEWRLAALAVAAVFLLTSCPAVTVRPHPAPPPAPGDTGKIRGCHIDHKGDPTDDRANAYGRLYWVERDGEVQPGFISVGRTDDGLVHVVNILDTETGSAFRMFYMERSNLPYRLVVECGDGSGARRTLVGTEVRHDGKSQELSLRLTDADDGSQTAVLSGVRLNSGLFSLKDMTDPYEAPLTYERYLVTMSACLLYAIGVSDMRWSEGGADFAQPAVAGRWSWGAFFGGLIWATAAVVTFVAAVVLSPAVVVAGGAVAVAVTTANAGWAVMSAAYAASAAVVLAQVEDRSYTSTSGEYGRGADGQPMGDPPRIAVWLVDSGGNPADDPGEGGWLKNDGTVHLHCQDRGERERLLCVQWLGGTRPVSIGLVQSLQSILYHKAQGIDSPSGRTVVVEPNTDNVEPVPERFYVSVTKTSDDGANNFNRTYIYLRFEPEDTNMTALINGRDVLETRLDDGNHMLGEEKRYRNTFKVNICTDEQYCPGE